MFDKLSSAALFLIPRTQNLFFFFHQFLWGELILAFTNFGGWELIGPTWDLIDKMACYVANANKEYNHSDL